MMSVLGLLVCFALSIHGTHCIKDGNSVNPCDYDGIAVVQLAGQIFCNGVISGGQLVLPETCASNLKTLSTYADLTVNYASGTETTTIPKGAFSTTLTDGIARAALPSFTPSGCFKEAMLYDKSTQTVDPSTCQMVSYGGETSADVTFDGSLEATSLTKISGVECCSLIDKEDTLNAEYAQVPTKDVPLNCVTSDGAACGIADLGAPIYCRTDTNELVVTGLTTSNSCVDGRTTLVNDLTDSDPNFKFGY
ncbi:uncharacterized protein LOC101855551 [Aplysia californica]|uniref:Uncharacterized protein LOC101855551 n=1 Tax=Aplysia californica TaxID=6500 RepID=A0ABM0ZWR0_APLCA|nr:uncharacterized protein LOC101855551 [Aplysia californica]